MNHVSQQNVISTPARDGARMDEVGQPAVPRPESNLSERPYKSASGSFDVLTPYIDPINRKWKRWVEDAGLAWGQLTEDDLLELETRRKTLGALVRARYAISADEADKQVTSFIEDHQACAL